MPGKRQKYVSITHRFYPQLGFPPLDGAIRHLLTKRDGHGKVRSCFRSPRFLIALFETAASAITDDLQETRSRSERITKFREFMRDGPCIL